MQIVRIGMILACVLVAGQSAEKIERRGQMLPGECLRTCDLLKLNNTVKAEILSSRAQPPHDFLDKMELSDLEAADLVRTLSPVQSKANTLWLIWSRVEPFCLAAYVEQWTSATGLTSYFAVQPNGGKWMVLQKENKESGGNASSILPGLFFVEFSPTNRTPLIRLIQSAQKRTFGTNIFAMHNRSATVVLRPNSTNFISISFLILKKIMKSSRRRRSFQATGLNVIR